MERREHFTDRACAADRHDRAGAGKREAAGRGREPPAIDLLLGVRAGGARALLHEPPRRRAVARIEDHRTAGSRGEHVGAARASAKHAGKQVVEQPALATASGRDEQPGTFTEPRRDLRARSRAAANPECTARRRAADGVA